MLLDNLIPGRTLSKDADYASFVKELSKYSDQGDFSLINPNNLEELITSFLFELPRNNCLTLIDKDGGIHYENVFFGMRAEQKYIFCIDSRNSLNKEVQKNIKCPLIKITFFDHKEFIFYLIFNYLDLDGFLTTFYRWSNSFSEP